jgi:hypothetical protein
MLEHIAVRTALDEKGRLDVGLLAEVILFYGQVHLILDRGMLGELTREIGVANLLRLLSSGYARATFMREMAAILTAEDMFVPTLIQMGRKERKGLASPEEEIAEILERAGEEPKSAKRDTRKLLDSIALGKFNDGTPKGMPFVGQFALDMRDKPDLLSQARLVLSHQLPRQNSARLTRFNAHEVKAGHFLIDTDLNWAKARADYRRLRGDSSAIFGAANILAQIQSGYIDLGLAARFGSELLTSDLEQQLIAERVSQVDSTKRAQ